MRLMDNCVVCQTRLCVGASLFTTQGTTRVEKNFFQERHLLSSVKKVGV